jgi:hypothetical protein
MSMIAGVARIPDHPRLNLVANPVLRFISFTFVYLRSVLHSGVQRFFAVMIDAHKV